LIPFGQLPGYLQANYGLLVTPSGGELIELPQQPSAMNSIRRTGKLTLDPAGMLKGEVKETRLGERASSERGRLRTVTKDVDRIKPIEELSPVRFPALGSHMPAWSILSKPINPSVSITRSRRRTMPRTPATCCWCVLA